MIVEISRGAHGRNVKLPPLSAEPRQFAHYFDPLEAEDYLHQAANFMNYASALGGNIGPHVLLGPPEKDDFTKMQMAEWAVNVTTATGVRVDIR